MLLVIYIFLAACANTQQMVVPTNEAIDDSPMPTQVITPSPNIIKPVPISVPTQQSKPTPTNALTLTPAPAQDNTYIMTQPTQPPTGEPEMNVIVSPVSSPYKEVEITTYETADRKDELITCETANKKIRKPIEAGGKEYLFSFDYSLSFTRTSYKHDNYVIEGGSIASVFLNIYDPDMHLIQTIEFESSCMWEPEVFHDLNVNEWRIVDYNFDGYQDIICLRHAGGSKANHFYIGWLWNPKTLMFEKANIDNIFNLSIHAKDHSLRSFESASAVYQIYGIYRFIDGAFVLTNELNMGKENSHEVEGTLHNYDYTGVFVNELVMIDGELKKVFPDYICDTEEGRAIINNRLYGDDSIWFGKNSPDFFASAYGDGIEGFKVERDEE